MSPRNEGLPRCCPASAAEKRMSTNSFHGDEKGVLHYEERHQCSETGRPRRAHRHGGRPQPFRLHQHLEHEDRVCVYPGGCRSHPAGPGRSRRLRRHGRLPRCHPLSHRSLFPRFHGDCRAHRARVRAVLPQGTDPRPRRLRGPHQPVHPGRPASSRASSLPSCRPRASSCWQRSCSGSSRRCPPWKGDP